MGRILASSFVLGTAAAVLVGAPGPIPAVRAPSAGNAAFATVSGITTHYRAYDAFDGVYCAILAALEARPDLGRRFERSARELQRGDFRLDEDLKASLIAHNQVSLSFTTVGLEDLQEIIDLRLRFGELGVALRDSVTREIDAVEERVDRFASLFPSKSVERQRLAIALAREDVADITTELRFSKSCVKMRKALSRLKSVRTFPYVAKPPRGKCSDVLPNGAFAEGSWALFDFDEQTTYPGFFRANRGTAQRFSNGTMLDVSFGYCDGIDRHQVDVGFVCPASVGTHVVTGNLTQGPNTLCCSLSTGSRVTIEAIDPVAGYVSGTFDLRASNGSGGGPGRFFLQLEPE